MRIDSICLGYDTVSLVDQIPTFQTDHVPSECQKLIMQRCCIISQKNAACTMTMPRIFITSVSVIRHIDISSVIVWFLDSALTYLLTYLLTPWSRVLLDKVNGLQLVKKFPSFYGTRRFITAFTSARHLSLSRASSIQSIPHILLPEDLS